jgi:predicted ATPase
LQRVDYLIEGYTPLGYVLTYQGEFKRARELLERGIELYEAHRGESLAFVTPQDSGVACLGLLASVQWMLGYPDQALRRAYDALALARALDQPFNLAYAHNYVTGIHSLRGEYDKAIEHAEAAFAISSAHGFDVWRVSATLHLAALRALFGDLEAGVAQLTDGLAAWRACGTELLRPLFLIQLAEICRLAGKLDQAVAAVEEGLAHADKSGEHQFDALLYRVRGGLALARGGDDGGAAESDFRRAIAIAQQQEAKSFELAAATSLSHLLRAQGRGADARNLLQPVYAWFTEGFETWDLRAAELLLAELS